MHDLRRLSNAVGRMFRAATFRDANFPDGLGCATGVGVESQRNYHWDGMHRGGTPDHPLVTMQLTLAGWGYFQSGPVAARQPPERVDPGQAFICTIPSEHRYWLPTAAREWRHVWICFHHPYACQRIAADLANGRAVITMVDDELLLGAFLRIVKGVTDGSFRDRFALEDALLGLAVAFARLTELRSAPIDERLRMLGQIESAVAMRPEDFITVAELARDSGLSRGHYSARFRAVTGMTPAQSLIRARVEMARRQLTTTTDPISLIATRCGFPDASHFGKVFRRLAGIAPSQLRRRTIDP